MKKEGKGKIIIYTLPYCHYCHTLKDTLDSKGIPYTDINIEENEKLGDELEEKYQTSSWPIILFFPNNNPNHPITIISSTNLDILDKIHIFTTIHNAIEIITNYYYEI